MKKLFYVGLLSVSLLLTACGGEEKNSDETSTYKVTPGEITNEKLLNNLAVRAETIVEQYDGIDNVTVDSTDITVEKLADLKNNETEEIYKNVYYIDGTYTWENKKYDFEWSVSFEENDTDVGGKILQYTSDSETGEKVNVDRSPVK